ncbi:unnamed protein product [Rotaria sordida]|uniref:Uncharacterized protein n=1 Tax=Rotaria sordida TaxID=392033 RepID=A0A815CPL6_9BILA|nr:unnamed protein product [Rotaria sordida]CAF1344350.1 unnamed protein product [Rotaria sordida]CAF1563823.1 unnamed protein product [Rotaria sordida]CAF4076829.1 unnamed protein product [Rotaria sordida]
MYNSSSPNINDENVEQQLSQEYSDKSYHHMQPVSFICNSQSTIDINHPDPSLSHVRDPRFDIHQTTNRPLSSIHNSITSNNNDYVVHVTSTELPVKKRRDAACTLVAPSTAPLPRKRFNPAAQSTAATMMNNTSGGENILSSRAVNAATRSISEATQNRFNQMLKPLIKLCEETNQLVKDMLKQMTEQAHLIKELPNAPRELQKTTEQLSYIVHMQAKVLQTSQQNDEEDLIFKLNGTDLSHIARGPSLNVTARSLVRAAYGEKASFNDFAPGEFDRLLVLTQSSSYQQQQQRSIINNLNNDIISFSTDNRLYGNIKFIFYLFLINQSFNNTNIIK